MPTSVSAARRHFPGAIDKVFMDSACRRWLRGLRWRQSRNSWAYVGVSDGLVHQPCIFMDDMRAAAASRGETYQRTEDEIALVESTTHG
jgi:hypothetical protein